MKAFIVLTAFVMMGFINSANAHYGSGFAAGYSAGYTSRYCSCHEEERKIDDLKREIRKLKEELEACKEKQDSQSLKR